MLHWFGKRLNELHEKNRDQRGFTLIELLVVVIIIGILAAIAIPIFLNQRASAQDNAARSQLRNAATAQQAYYTENNAYTETEADLAGFGFPTGGNPDVVISSASADSYCMQAASASGTTFRITTTVSSPEEGSCSGA